MKYYITLLLCVFTASTLSAQATKCCIPTGNGSEAAVWYKWSRPNIKKIGLEDLTRTKDKLHFRFSTETKFVDVWTKNFKSFSGLLSLYTESVPKDNNSIPKGKFYDKKIVLDELTAKNVYLLFDSLSVFNIPKQEDIKAWRSGYDGDIFLIEYSTSNMYSFKSYWTPSSYPNIKEAVIIDTLSKRLDNMLAMSSNWGKFVHALPQGTYTAGGMMVVLNDVIVNKKK